MIQVQGYYVLACAMWIYMREETNEMPIKPYEKRLIFITFSFYIGRMLNTRAHVVCGSIHFASNIFHLNLQDLIVYPILGWRVRLFNEK